MKPTDDELARFAAVVAARLGLRVDVERSRELIERRAEIHREPVRAYLDRLDANAIEVDVLANELTVGETYFLRHIEQFRAFADIVVPDRLSHGRLRVLSAGCSSGEEPYTLAMLLRESCASSSFAVRGIDLNPKAIARARAARYSRWSLRATTPAFEQRWFQSDGRDVVVVPEIRAAVKFDHANVLDDDDLGTPSQWDVVFCRNVMMYFTDDQADALIARIARSLSPGGFLFLGHAENLRDRSDDFVLCHTHGTFYYQRNPATTAGGVARAHTVPQVAQRAAILPDTGWYDDIRAATQRVHEMVELALDQKPGSKAVGELPAAPPDLGQIRELLAQERFGEALDRLERVAVANARDHDVAMLRAVVLTQAGRFPEARTACEELLAVAATRAGANYLLALCCDSTGDTDGAAVMAQSAAELDPTFAMPRVHLGLLARRIGDRELASRELTRAIALLEREAPSRLALYGGGFSRQTLLGLCRAELAAIGAPR